MHRSAAPARAAVRLAVHLGHDLPSGDPANQRMAVLPIGCHDVVLAGGARAWRPRRRLLHRCRGAKSPGSSASSRARRSFPRADARGSCPVAARAHGLVKHRASIVCSFQRRGVTFGKTELSRFEQPAHDLPAARLGQRFDAIDLARRGRAEVLATEAEQLLLQILAP